MSKERIARIVAQLREMTTSRGCSEAEAMAAAGKLAKLMAEHGLRDGEVDFDQDEVETRVGLAAVRSKLWGAIAECTNTAHIQVDDTIVYIGRSPWPKVATYLHRVTNRAIERELRGFRETTWYKRRRTPKAKRKATAEFTLAMVARLTGRLYALFDATISPASLIAADTERTARFPKSQTVKPRAPVTNDYADAQLAGWNAGEAVTLSHAVGGNASTLQIGGSS